MQTCGAKTRGGAPCKNAAMPNGRCRMHGGKTPSGIASPHFKTGRHSKSIPTRLAATYEVSRNDPDLLALNDEIALTDAQIDAVLGELEDGDTESRSAKRNELDNLIERRRRLVDSETRRRVNAQEMMSAQEVLTFLGAIVGIIRSHVQDPYILAAIARDIEGLVGSANVRMVDSGAG